VPKHELSEELKHSATRASVKRPGRTQGMWRVQVRRAGLVTRTSWHREFQAALDDALLVVSL
jgi:hypothetical protein